MNVSGGQAAPDGSTPRLSNKVSNPPAGILLSWHHRVFGHREIWVLWFCFPERGEQGNELLRQNGRTLRLLIMRENGCSSQQPRSTASLERKYSSRGLPQIIMLVNVPIGRDSR